MEISYSFSVGQKPLPKLDKDKTIVFYNNSAPFTGDELDKRGVGGSETALIHIAKLLAMKFNVVVYCNCTEEGEFNKVLYRSRANMLEELRELNCDLFIIMRSLDPILHNPNLKQDYNIKKIAFWSQDLAENYAWDNFDKIHEKIDHVVLISKFHKKNVMAMFPMLDENKIVIAENGIDPNNFKDKIKKIKGKCIYSSTPYRGLDVLLKVWPEIKARVPHAELFVFSSFKVYSQDFDDSPWEKLFEAARSMHGVHNKGAIKQDELAKHYMSSELLLYPNTYPETSCITAMEAQAAGTPIVTTALAALPETVKQGCGILIKGDPKSEEYQKRFVEASVELLTEKQKWETMHKECLKYDFSWQRVIPVWESLI